MGNVVLKSSSPNAGSMREVFRLAYPTVVAMLAQVAVSMTDVMVAGRLGTAELAAVGLANSLLFGAYSLAWGTLEIVNTFVSQALGARKGRLSSIAWQGIYLSLLFWPPFLVMAYFLDDLLLAIGPSASVQNLALAYGQARLWGSGLLFVFIALSAFFQGAGRVRIPMYAVLILATINILFDFVLVFGGWGLPALGVTGAAWASNLALLAGVLVLAAVFFGPSMEQRFSTRRSYGLEPRLIGRMLTIGLPAGARLFFDVAGFSVFVAMIGRMGDVFLAASNLALQVTSLSFNVVCGVAVATTTLTGTYLGAGRPDLAARAARNSFRLVAAYLLGVTAFLVLFNREITAVFGGDGEVQLMAGMFILIGAVFMFFDGLGQIAVGALRGAGDTRWPMMAALAGAWVFFLPAAYFLGFVAGRGALGAWSAATIYIVLVSVAYLVRYYAGPWRKKALFVREKIKEESLSPAA